MVFNKLAKNKINGSRRKRGNTEKSVFRPLENHHIAPKNFFYKKTSQNAATQQSDWKSGKNWDKSENSLPRNFPPEQTQSEVQN